MLTALPDGEVQVPHVQMDGQGSTSTSEASQPAPEAPEQSTASLGPAELAIRNFNLEHFETHGMVTESLAKVREGDSSSVSSLDSHSSGVLVPEPVRTWAYRLLHVYLIMYRCV